MAYWAVCVSKLFQQNSFNKISRLQKIGPAKCKHYNLWYTCIYVQHSKINEICKMPNLVAYTMYNVRKWIIHKPFQMEPWSFLKFTDPATCTYNWDYLLFCIQVNIWDYYGNHCTTYLGSIVDCMHIHTCTVPLIIAYIQELLRTCTCTCTWHTFLLLSICHLMGKIWGC